MMRYDEGYGRYGGWEQRMPDGGRGWDRGYPDPRRGGEPADRPWVGGYREGYQGGSGGYALGTSGPLYERYEAFDDRGQNRERGYRRPRGQEGRGRMGGRYFVRARASEYGADFGGGDRFAYEDAAGGTDFGPGNARPGFGQLGHVSGGGQNRGGYGADFGRRPAARRGGYGGDFRGSPGGGYDRGMRGGGTDYDQPFRNEGRPEDYHPRYSPVGGTYAPLGGAYSAYRAGQVPRPLQDTWTSEWTRWF
ncbi:hypothetical protein [Longimicrobium sp.]|uniref:hypothetical protein n=1 Tax=Longimicrobium sp. TaxID=2029185 RepID=UPI002E2FB55F|nr:hypothetical protein [Longimicrobium sp.]HEX6041366.1 hypothetical protein [Longimicrobium sp.]